MNLSFKIEGNNLGSSEINPLPESILICRSVSFKAV